MKLVPKIVYGKSSKAEVERFYKLAMAMAKGGDAK